MNLPSGGIKPLRVCRTCAWYDVKTALCGNTASRYHLDHRDETDICPSWEADAYGQDHYLQRQRVRDEVLHRAAADTERQYTVDLFCLVLTDPGVLGDRALDRDLLAAVVRAVSDEYDRWKEALTVDAEADYARERLDDRLRAAVGEDRLVLFDQRYEWVRQVRTGKN